MSTASHKLVEGRQRARVAEPHEGAVKGENEPVLLVATAFARWSASHSRSYHSPTQGRQRTARHWIRRPARGTQCSDQQNSGYYRILNTADQCLGFFSIPLGWRSSLPRPHHVARPPPAPRPLGEEGLARQSRVALVVNHRSGDETMGARGRRLACNTHAYVHKLGVP